IKHDTPLPVGVIGTGRMGRLHARTYAKMPEVKLVGVYDMNADSASDVAGEFHTQPFSEIGELLSHVAAVTIATPTMTHLEMARACLSRRVPCLIEKPLAKDSREAAQIVELSRANDTMVQVGHIERFNPAVRAVDRLKMVPRFIEVTRISPLTFRSIDVGVVLDMM